MTGLVLLQQGLDVALALELGEGGAVRQQGGTRLLVANPADRAALEWALAVTDHVTALSVGPSEALSVLELALARGASRGIRLWDEALSRVDAAAMSRLIARAVGVLAPDLLLAGERGLEGATGILPALVAVRLGWPCLDGALRVTRESDSVTIERRLGKGRREEVAADCPVVVTVTRDSIEPRYVSVRARQYAKRLPIETWDLAGLGLSPETVQGWVRLFVDRLDWPRPRPRRTAQVSRGLAAAERLRQLSGGGPRTAKPVDEGTTTGRVLQGEPGQIADRLLAFLESRGLV